MVYIVKRHSYLSVDLLELYLGFFIQLDLKENDNAKSKQVDERNAVSINTGKIVLQVGVQGEREEWEGDVDSTLKLVHRALKYGT